MSFLSIIQNRMNPDININEDIQTPRFNNYEPNNYINNSSTNNINNNKNNKDIEDEELNINTLINNIISLDNDTVKDMKPYIIDIIDMLEDEIKDNI